MAAGAIARSHVRHEYAQHTISFTHQRLDRATDPIARIPRWRIAIEAAGMTMMNYDQHTVGTLWNEMIRKSLQPWSHVDPQFVNTLGTFQLLHRTRDIGDHVRQAVFGNATVAPDILNQRLPLLPDLRRGMNRDRSIVDQFCEGGTHKRD